MNYKALIIEDNPQHYKLFAEGVAMSKYKFDIEKVELPALIAALNKGEGIELIPDGIDLFIIDVSLDKGQDELGLKLFNQINLDHRRTGRAIPIVVSNWERSEFHTDVTFDKKNFINKNHYQGIELAIKTRNTINILWKTTTTATE